MRISFPGKTDRSAGARADGFVFVDVLLFTVIVLLGATAAFALLARAASVALETQLNAIEAIEERNRAEVEAYALPLPEESR